MTEPALTLADAARALADVLAALPEKALLDFARLANLPTSGHRPGGATAVLCTHILNALRPKLAALDKGARAFVRSALPEARLLALFSPEALAQHRPALMAFFGKARYALALLADEREALRESVPALLAAEGGDLPEPEAAAQTLERLFAPACRLSANPAGNTRLQQRLESLQQELDEQKKANKRLRAEAETRLRDAERSAKSQIATLEFSVAEQKRRAEELEQKLDKERQACDRRADARFNCRRIAFFRHWLEPCVRAEDALAADGPGDLAARVEQALALQAQADRASQNRAELGHRLQTARDLLAKVDGTLAGAVVRHPALLAVREELARECARLDEALRGPEIALSPYAEALRVRIDALEATDDRALGALLRTSERLGLLTKAELAELADRLGKRMMAWGLSMPELDRRTMLLREALENTLSDAERRNPLLAKALRGETAALLFVDAHNVLNGLGRYTIGRGAARTHEENRRRLEDDLCALLEHNALVHAYVVWDGKQTSECSRADNVTVHYSGGEGDHRADRYILDLLRFHGQPAGDEDPLPRIVVTDDNDFGGQAVRLGAVVCRIHDFEAFLNALRR